MLPGAEPSLAVSDHMAAVALRLARTAAGAATAADSIHKMAASAVRSGRRFVLLLDEFQEVTHGSRATLGRFRARLQKPSEITVIFLGTRTHTWRVLLAERGQIF